MSSFPLRAESYCRSHGQRLPTLRELALYAQSLGAQGVSESAKDDYTCVKTSESDGKPDIFCYEKNGYQRPEGDPEDVFYWSSSIVPVPALGDNDFVLRSTNARIVYAGTSEDHASSKTPSTVRCIESH